MVAFLVGPRTPAVGHAINALPVRPVVGGIRPVVPGLRASVVFAQGWQVRVANTTGVEATVLDAGDRPFLRLGPSGVFADFAAFSWYQSNTFDSPVRPPEGLRPDAAPDWHRVAVEPAWSWFDPRLKPDRSVLTDEILRSNLHADVGSWTIPVRYGEMPGSINGRLRFEPAQDVDVPEQPDPRRPSQLVLRQ